MKYQTSIIVLNDIFNSVLKVLIKNAKMFIII